MALGGRKEPVCCRSSPGFSPRQVYSSGLVENSYNFIPLGTLNVSQRVFYATNRPGDMVWASLVVGYRLRV